MLPNVHLAVVEPEKSVDCLLNPAHPDRDGKAARVAERRLTPEPMPSSLLQPSLRDAPVLGLREPWVQTHG
jgi:hypothetical protein